MPDEKLIEAARVLADAVARNDTPQLLFEFGPSFEEKYMFIRLDWVRTTAGAMGYETSAMRDPREPRHA